MIGKCFLKYIDTTKPFSPYNRLIIYSTTSPPCSLQVITSRKWKIIINNLVKFREMQPSSTQIRRQQQPCLRIPKQLIISQSRFFTQLTMQSYCRYCLGIEKILKLMQTTNCVAKDHGF